MVTRRNGSSMETRGRGSSGLPLDVEDGVYELVHSVWPSACMDMANEQTQGKGAAQEERAEAEAERMHGDVELACDMLGGRLSDVFINCGLNVYDRNLAPLERASREDMWDVAVKLLSEDMRMPDLFGRLRMFNAASLLDGMLPIGDARDGATLEFVKGYGNKVTVRLTLWIEEQPGNMVIWDAQEYDFELLRTKDMNTESFTRLEEYLLGLAMAAGEVIKAASLAGSYVEVRDLLGVRQAKVLDLKTPQMAEDFTKALLVPSRLCTPTSRDTGGKDDKHGRNAGDVRTWAGCWQLCKRLYVG